MNNFVVACLIGGAGLAGMIFFLRKWNRANMRHAAQCEKSAVRRQVKFSPFAEGEGLQLQNKEYFQRSVAFETLAVQLADPSPEARHEAIEGIDSRAAFFVRNFLTPDECAKVIAGAEFTGFQTRRFEGGNRDSASSICLCPEFAATMHQRIEQFLPERSYYDAGIGVVLDDVDFENQEVPFWGTRDCCNSSIRVEKYDASQSLKLHRDGCVLVKDKKDTFTVFAILIYLNDKFSNGMTRFAKNRTPQLRSPSLSPHQDEWDPYTFIDIKGNVGDALVFRHEFLHSGGEVHNGRKYVLRLDAAYKLEK